MQVAHHHACGNLQRPAQRDADVREVAAHAGALLEGLQGVGRLVADAVLIGEVIVDPGADRLHLRIARLNARDQRLRALFHLVARTVATLEQELQRRVRQRLNRRVRSLRIHGDGRLGVDDNVDADAHAPLRDDEPLAEVAERIDVLGGRHVWFEEIGFAGQPLREAAAGTQHGDCRAVLAGGDFQVTAGFQSHRHLVVG